MQQIQYTGEHLWIQYLGYGLIILAFVSALYTSLTSFLSRRQDDTDVKVAMERWSRYGLQFHAVSLFSVIGLILWLDVVRGVDGGIYLVGWCVCAQFSLLMR